jgi:hypothetical protein
VSSATLRRRSRSPPALARRRPHARIRGRRIDIQWLDLSRAARKQPQPLDLDPMDLDQPDPVHQVNPAASLGNFAEKPLSFLYSQIYPSTLEVFLQFSHFSLF